MIHHVLPKGGPVVKRFNKTPLLLSIAIVAIFVCGVLAYDLTQQEVDYEVAGAHLDTQWQWDLAATVSTYIPNTLNTNFAYFTQYPEYNFSWESAFRYWLIKVNYPSLYTTLKSYVAGNRWNLAGGGEEASDVNIPSPEGIIRNYLYGNEFFDDEFGQYSDDVYLPDCFGFGYALPTIAAHMGLIGFCTQKFDLWGGWFPTPFPIGRWIGVDGSSLIAALKPGAYDNGMDIQTADGDWLKSHSGTPGIWATYDYIGTGDQGGGPSAGNVSAMVTRIRANASNTIKVYCARSDQLYRDLTPTMIAQLPSYQGELVMTTHGTGSYTSWAKMKYKNRKNEQLGMLTEFADVTANWTSLGTFAYPQDTIWHAWWRFIDCTFHDGITGTSIPNVYSQYDLPMEDSSSNDFSYALGLGNNVMANSVGQQLTTTVGAAGDVPLVLVNALARARCDVVQATVNFGTAAPA
jgi:alpha-mannosidase